MHRGVHMLRGMELGEGRRAAFPAVRIRLRYRRDDDGDRDGERFDAQRRPCHRRWRDEVAGEQDLLAEGTIGRIVASGGFAGLLIAGGDFAGIELRGSDVTERQLMDVYLGDIGLQREGKERDKRNRQPRGVAMQHAASDRRHRLWRLHQWKCSKCLPASLSQFDRAEQQAGCAPLF